ncbi:MAG: aminotransferase class I/II-fold pyridoxal phosphate-dependent enzyme [Candidatus Abawacabacteria bacterium]|nr:aminotransferase class I/II-fold pyridoxal phosphate-dependent enzyme [Candidatus Abawacabacteria bacterium]
MKHLFFDDYSEGAHPAILEHIMNNNNGQERGYGYDSYSQKAENLIRKEISSTNADVYFLPNGTQINFTVIAAMLRSHEGVIAPTSAHINVHECGAIEATGHKIIAIESANGKLTPAHVEQAFAKHHDEHTVKPKVVYLTQATETGTTYSLTEFEDVANYARSKGLLVYLDGARLAMAIANEKNGITLKDITRLVDAFYIGGTKNGGMYGEAVVIINPELQKDFRYHIKQRGGLMAKGRFIALQFERFFGKDQLWFELGKLVNQKAQKLYQGLVKVGIEFENAPNGNQLFPILNNKLITELQKEYGFYVWQNGSERSTCRLTCSWATPDTAINDFIQDTRNLINKL